MHKSTLLEILRTFSKQELMKFEDFVRSPYFNKKENVVKLFLEIKKYAPGLKDISLEKEKVWYKVFPGSQYNYGIMKNLIFDLSKLVEQYIIVVKSGQNKLSESKYLLSYLNEKNLPKLFFNKFESIERTHDHKFFNRHNYAADEYYNYWFELQGLKAQVAHYASNKLVSLDNESLNLTLSFLINSFKLYQNLIVQKSGWNIHIENNPTAYFLKQISAESFNNILENIKKTSETDYLYLKIYYRMYCMYQDNRSENYLQFKKILFENISLFSQKDLRDLHFCLISGNNLITNSEINTPSEKLRIFDSMIRHNILTEPNGIIAEHIFIYYVYECSKENNKKSIINFYEKFIDKSNKDVRANLSKFTKSLILFIEEKYGDSLDLMSQVDPEYFAMKTYFKIHKGMCLYKMEDYNSFLSEYDSVKHFIKNTDKVIDRYKNSVESLYYFLNILFKLRDNFNEYELSEIKKEVIDKEKSWLYKEICTLEILYLKKKKNK